MPQRSSKSHPILGSHGKRRLFLFQTGNMAVPLRENSMANQEQLDLLRQDVAEEWKGWRQ